MTDAERAAGRRADFHVYYRRDGKLFFDAMWAAMAEKATAKMLDFARQLRWKIQIVRVDPLNRPLD
jgi:hypothetical protein